MNLIADFLEHSQMTQEELAAKIDRKQASISYYKNGKKKPGPVTLKRLQEVDPEYFNDTVIYSINFLGLGDGGK